MATAEGGPSGSKLISHARESGVTVHYMSEGDLRSAFRSAPWLKRNGCANHARGGKEEELQEASNLDRTLCKGREGRDGVAGEAADGEQQDASCAPKPLQEASEDESLPASERPSSEGETEGCERQIVALQKVEINALREEVQLLQEWQNEAIVALEEEVRKLRGGQNQEAEALKEQVLSLQREHEEIMASMKAELQEARTAHCMVLAKSAAVAELRGAEMAALGEEAGRAGEAVDALRGELEEARGCVRAKGEEIRRLQKTILSKDEEIHSAKEDALSVKRELERELEDVERLRLEQKSERDLLLGERAALKGKCDRLEEERREKGAEVQRLEDECRKFKEMSNIIKDAEVRRLNDEARKLKETNDTAVKELRDTISILEQKRKRVLVDYIALKGHCDGLEGDLEEKNKTVQALRGRARKLNEEVRSLKEKNDGAAAEHSALKRKCDHLEAEKRERKEEVRALKDSMRRMKEGGVDISTKELSVAALHNQTTAENSALREKCDRLEGEIRAKDDEARALKEEARRIKKGDAARCKELRAKHEEMRALKEEARRLRVGDAARFKELRERERRLTAGIDSSMRELRDEYEGKLDDANETLKSLTNSLRAGVESRDAAIRELGSDNERLRAQVKEQGDSKEAPQARLKTTVKEGSTGAAVEELKRDNERLSRQLEKQGDANRALQEETIELHGKEGLCLRAEIDSVKSEIASKDAVIEELKGDNEHLGLQLERQGDANGALQARLRMALKSLELRGKEGLSLEAELDSAKSEIASKNTVIEELKRDNGRLGLQLERTAVGKEGLSLTAEMDSAKSEIALKDAVIEGLKRENEGLRHRLEEQSNIDGALRAQPNMARRDREEIVEPRGKDGSAPDAEISFTKAEIESRDAALESLRGDNERLRRRLEEVGRAPPDQRRQKQFAFLHTVSESFEMPTRRDPSIDTIDDEKDDRNDLVSGGNFAAAERDAPARAAAAVTPPRSGLSPSEKASSKEAFRSMDDGGRAHFGFIQTENAKCPSSHAGNAFTGSHRANDGEHSLSLSGESSNGEAGCSDVAAASEHVPQSECSHTSEDRSDERHASPPPQVACDRITDDVPMHREDDADDPSQSPSVKTGESAADGPMAQESAEALLGAASSLDDAFKTPSLDEEDGDHGVTVRGTAICTNKKLTDVPACTSLASNREFAPLSKHANAFDDSGKSQVVHLEPSQVACDQKTDAVPMHQRGDADDSVRSPSTHTGKLSDGLSAEESVEDLPDAASMDDSIKKLSANERDGVCGIAAKGAPACSGQKELPDVQACVSAASDGEVAPSKSENALGDGGKNQVDMVPQVACDQKTGGDPMRRKDSADGSAHSPSTEPRELFANGLLAQENVKESLGAAASSIKKSFANEKNGDGGTAARSNRKEPLGDVAAFTSASSDSGPAPSKNENAPVGGGESRAVHLDAAESTEPNLQSNHFCTRRESSAERQIPPSPLVARDRTTGIPMHQRDNACDLVQCPIVVDGVSSSERVEKSPLLKTIGIDQSPRMAASRDGSVKQSPANKDGGDSGAAAGRSANTERKELLNVGSNGNAPSIDMNLFGDCGKSESGDLDAATRAGPNLQSNHFCARKNLSSETHAPLRPRIARSSTTDTPMHREDKARGPARNPESPADGFSARESSKRSPHPEGIKSPESFGIAASIDDPIKMPSAVERDGEHDTAPSARKGADADGKGLLGAPAYSKESGGELASAKNAPSDKGKHGIDHETRSPTPIADNLGTQIEGGKPTLPQFFGNGSKNLTSHMKQSIACMGKMTKKELQDKYFEKKKNDSAEQLHNLPSTLTNFENKKTDSAEQLHNLPSTQVAGGTKREIYSRQEARSVSPTQRGGSPKLELPGLPYSITSAAVSLLELFMKEAIDGKLMHAPSQKATRAMARKHLKNNKRVYARWIDPTDPEHHGTWMPGKVRNCRTCNDHAKRCRRSYHILFDNGDQHENIQDEDVLEEEAYRSKLAVAPSQAKTKWAKSATPDETALTQDGSDNPAPVKPNKIAVEVPKLRPMEKEDAPIQNESARNTVKRVKSATSDENVSRRDESNDPTADEMNEKAAGLPEIRPAERAPAARFGPGWTVEIVKRKSGRKDRYFISPEGKRFRSAAEVQRYLESNPTREAPGHGASKLGRANLNPMEKAPGNDASAKSGGRVLFDWDRCIEALEEYYKTHGNCYVTEQSGAKKLAQFVKKIRVYKRQVNEGAYTGKLLTPDRIRRLDDMGFQWVGRDAGKRKGIDACGSSMGLEADEGSEVDREGGQRPADASAPSKDDAEIGPGSDKTSEGSSRGGTAPRVGPCEKRITTMCDLEYVDRADRGTSKSAAFGIRGDCLHPKAIRNGIRSGQSSSGRKRGSADVSSPGGHAAAWPRTKHAREALSKRSKRQEQSQPVKSG